MYRYATRVLLSLLTRAPALLLIIAAAPSLSPVNYRKQTCSEYLSKKDARACVCLNKYRLSRFSSQKTGQQKTVGATIPNNLLDGIFTPPAHHLARGTRAWCRRRVHYFLSLAHDTDVSSARRTNPAFRRSHSGRGRVQRRTPVQQHSPKLHATNIPHCPQE